MKRITFLILLISVLNAQNIKVAMTADISNNVSYLGKNMKVGIETYFHKYNSLNKKHNFSLDVFDDLYSPLLAIKNTQKVINDKQYLAFLGNVGTPTGKLTIPLISRSNISLLGAYTGGNFLRENSKNIFNYRVSYGKEASLLVKKLLLLGIKPNEIAFFTQNDAYGDAGYFGAISVLKKTKDFNESSVFNGKYSRVSLNVEGSLANLLDMPNDPKVILMIATTKPIIKFMTLAKEDFKNTLFISISPIEHKKIISELKEKAENLIITQTVPLLNSNLPIIKEFKKDLKEFSNKDANLISLEGYIVAKLFVKAIEKSKKDNLSREDIISILENIKPYNIGLGFSSNFNNKEHQYSHKIWASFIKDGKLLKLDWESIEVK